MVGDTLGKVRKSDLLGLVSLFILCASRRLYLRHGQFELYVFPPRVPCRLPAWVGSLFFVLLFGGFVYLGTRRVDLCNRGLMFVKSPPFYFGLYWGFPYPSCAALSNRIPNTLFYGHAAAHHFFWLSQHDSQSGELT